MSQAPAGRAAVLGKPIAHSLSPVLHQAAYDALELDWSYEAVECDEDELEPFLGSLGPSWRGLSLTMPLKQAVLHLLDDVEQLARDVEAANTVVLERGRRRGFNTDVPAFVAALAEAGVERVGFASVLGGGATARSALAALARLGVMEPVVYLRRLELEGRMKQTAERLGQRLSVLPWEIAEEAMVADLVISTVPAGATDQLALRVPKAPGVLFDVVYSPWPTVLARHWSDLGGRVVGGFELLLHQAALQVDLMTGRSAPLAAMREAGEAALATRRR